NKEHQTSDENGGDGKVGRIVSLIVPIIGRYQMTPCVVGMVKSDVIAEKNPAKPMMTEAVVEESLAARDEEMSADRDENQQQQLPKRPVHQLDNHQLISAPSWTVLRCLAPPPPPLHPPTTPPSP